MRRLLSRWFALLRQAICPTCGRITAGPAGDVIAAAPQAQPARRARRPIARLGRGIVSPFGQGPGRSRRRGPSRPMNRIPR